MWMLQFYCELPSCSGLSTDLEQKPCGNKTTMARRALNRLLRRVRVNSNSALFTALQKPIENFKKWMENSLETVLCMIYEFFM